MTVQEYLDKGFDQKTAAYFAAGRRKVISVEAGDNFVLTLTFDNGEARFLDCKPFMEEGTVFAALRSPEVFRRVYLDAQSCVCWDKDPDVDSEKVWSNKIDLSPDTCYLDSVPLEASA